MRRLTRLVPMRDGPKLYTVVCRPKRAAGPLPVVLTRGYWPGFEDDARRFCRAGYAYVGQSTRGHGKSEGAGGIARRFFHDAADGHDTLSWIAEQDWSDGRVAMFGKSYWAITQWLVAALGHPNLRAIVPQVSPTDPWDCGYWRGGALLLAMSARGRAYDKRHWPEIDAMGWDAFFRHLPLRTLDEVVGSPNPDRVEAESRQLWRDYVEHSTFDDYWRALSMRADGADGHLSRIPVPVFQMGGWYDAYPGASLRVFETLQAAGNVPDNRIIIDPTDHLNRVAGDRDFGLRVGKDEISLAIRWLDHVVKGVENGVRDEKPVRMFAMGANEWREFDHWPPARAVPTKYYLHPGELRNDLPGVDVEPSRYTYDPADPVPTLGGNHSFSDVNIPHIIRPGAVDQRPIECRDDVLVFSTEPLATATEVTGPVRVRLFASSSAKDTDFVARLVDVAPDGTAYNLTEGILRARFRRSIWQQPELLTPGEVDQYDIELLPTSNVFRRGHRIRLHVTSSGFPLWDRNPNTGSQTGFDSEMIPAHQVVHHDRSRPSHVLLSLLPLA